MVPKTPAAGTPAPDVGVAVAVTVTPEMTVAVLVTVAPPITVGMGTNWVTVLVTVGPVTVTIVA